MRTIELQLDDLDYDAIQTAMAHRQTFRDWPDAESTQLAANDGDEIDSDPCIDGSNIAGLAVAEICRGWMEMLDLGRHDSSDK